MEATQDKPLKFNETPKKKSGQKKRDTKLVHRDPLLTEGGVVEFDAVTLIDKKDSNVGKSSKISASKKKRIEAVSHKLTMLQSLCESDFNRAASIYYNNADQRYLSKFKNASKKDLQDEIGRLNDRLMILVKF